METKDTPKPNEQVAPAPKAADAPANEGKGGAQETPETKPAPAKVDPDFKNLYNESSKEGVRLSGILKEYGIDPKTGKKTEPEAPEPAPLSDEQLAEAIPAYSQLDEGQRNLLKSVQGIPKLARMVAEMHDRQTTEGQIGTIKSTEGYELIGENEQEFREFIYKPENLKKDFALLADSFILAKMRAEAAAKADTPNTPPTTGMEDGGGAVDIEGKAGVIEITQEQAANMRKTDHKKYFKLVREKRLKIVDA